MKKLYILLTLLIFSCSVVKEQQGVNEHDIYKNPQPEIISTSQAGPAKHKYVVKSIQKGDSTQYISTSFNPESNSPETTLKSAGMPRGTSDNTQSQNPNTDFIFGWSTDKGEVVLAEEESSVELISKEQNCSFIKLIDKQSGIQSLHITYSSNNEAELLITFLNEGNNLNQSTILKASQDFTEKEIIFSKNIKPDNILIKINLVPYAYFKIRD